MSRLHVLDQLPLWVEGDLLPGEALQVDLHLTECEACREAAEALRTSQAWLKEAQEAPFGADDCAQVRAAVMARIHLDPSRPRRFPLRAALALAAAALCILTGTLLSRRLRHRPATPVLADLHSGLRTEAAGPGKNDPPRTLPPQTARTGPARTLLPRRQPEAPPRAVPALARLELQTSNPRIRIIWLAPRTAPAATSTPL